MAFNTMNKNPQDNFANSEKARINKARIILARESSIKKIKPGLYLVQSQSGLVWYKISCNPFGEWSCSCPDFVKNSHIRPCKHILAFRMRTLGPYDRDFNYTTPLKDRYSQTWSSYNLAQVQEFEFFDQFLYQLVSIIENPEKSGPGRPSIKLSDKIFCCIMKVYSQLSSRRASHLYNEAVHRQQIEHSPHFNVISNTLNDEELQPILQYLVRISAQPLTSIERDFAVDSSGFRCSTFGSYFEDKHKVKQSRNWLKVHICTGVLTNIVTDVVITEEHAGDSPQFKTLIENTAEHFLIDEVSADMAYSSRKNHTIVGQYGGKAYIPFRSNVKATSKGAPLWNRSYHYFQIHKDDFLDHYHKRSNVESTFAAIKKKFGETIKSKNRTAQVNEMLCKIIAYNITVLIRELIDFGADKELFHIFDLHKETTMNEFDNV